MDKSSFCVGELNSNLCQRLQSLKLTFHSETEFVFRTLYLNDNFLYKLRNVNLMLLDQIYNMLASFMILQ